MRNKHELIKDVDTAIALLEKTKLELLKADVNKEGNITNFYNCNASLSKIKRNCTTVRDLILDVRKGCEW